MLLYVEDSAHTTEPNFPANTIKLILDHEEFYSGTDYSYRFHVDGSAASELQPLALNATSLARRRYRLFDSFGEKLRLNQPSSQLIQLAMKLVESNMLEPTGGRGGAIWPIEFRSNSTLEIIKQAAVPFEDIEDYLFRQIADYFAVPLHGLVILYH